MWGRYSLASPLPYKTFLVEFWSQIQSYEGWGLGRVRVEGGTQMVENANRLMKSERGGIPHSVHSNNLETHMLEHLLRSSWVDPWCELGEAMRAYNNRDPSDTEAEDVEDDVVEGASDEEDELLGDADEAIVYPSVVRRSVAVRPVVPKAALAVRLDLSEEASISVEASVISRSSTSKVPHALASSGHANVVLNPTTDRRDVRARQKPALSAPRVMKAMKGELC